MDKALNNEVYAGNNRKNWRNVPPKWGLESCFDTINHSSHRERQSNAALRWKSCNMEARTTCLSVVLEKLPTWGGFSFIRASSIIIAMAMIKRNKHFQIESAIVLVPLIGSIACGRPIFADQYIEDMIPVQKSLLQPSEKYFVLRARGNSMDLAGINEGDMVLIKQTSLAHNGDLVVALIDDVATIKIFKRIEDQVELIPNSTDSAQRKIVSKNVKIQGVVVKTITKQTDVS